MIKERQDNSIFASMRVRPRASQEDILPTIVHRVSDEIIPKKREEQRLGTPLAPKVQQAFEDKFNVMMVDAQTALAQARALESLAQTERAVNDVRNAIEQAQKLDSQHRDLDSLCCLIGTSKEELRQLPTRFFETVTFIPLADDDHCAAICRKRANRKRRSTYVPTHQRIQVQIGRDTKTIEVIYFGDRSGHTEKLIREIHPSTSLQEVLPTIVYSRETANGKNPFLVLPDDRHTVTIDINGRLKVLLGEGMKLEMVKDQHYGWLYLPCDKDGRVVSEIGALTGPSKDGFYAVSAKKSFPNPPSHNDAMFAFKISRICFIVLIIRENGIVEMIDVPVRKSKRSRTTRKDFQVGAKGGSCSKSSQSSSVQSD